MTGIDDNEMNMRTASQDHTDMNAPVEVILVHHTDEGLVEVKALLAHVSCVVVEISHAEITMDALTVYTNVALIVIDSDLAGNAIHTIQAIQQFSNAAIVALLDDRMAKLASSQYRQLGVQAILTLPLQPDIFHLKVATLLELYHLKKCCADQHALKKSLELEHGALYKMIHASPFGMMVTDQDAVIQGANTALCRQADYSMETIIGQSAQLKFGNHTQDSYDQVWSSVKEMGAWEGEVFNKDFQGETYSEWSKIVPLHDAEGNVDGYMWSFLDVSAQSQANQRFYHLAHHDSLTGLPNRNKFSERLEDELLNAKRRKSMLAVMFMDLDHFKNINDSLGHDVGDLLLKEVSRILIRCVRKNDMIARQGGDEFIGILVDLRHAEDAAIVASKMLTALQKPMNIGGHQLFVSSSIGISVYPNDAENIDDLIKHADSSMYQAKEGGRGNYQFYTDELHRVYERRFVIESNLRSALEHQEFELLYQPQIDIATKKLVGVEALIRWHSAALGNVSPTEFIPVAEECGLIIDIGKWVLQTACNQHKRWEELGYSQMIMGINLSSVQFREFGFIDTLIETIVLSKASPTYIDLELTERIIMKDDVATIRTLNEIHECGIHLSIDDFGTGYSSMSYLKKFPIDKLKIDRAFIIDVANNADDAVIASAMIKLGHSLGLIVIAEGVEEIEQVEWLRKHGCDEIQGYYFSKPLPVSEMESYMKKTGILHHHVRFDPDVLLKNM